MAKSKQDKPLVKQFVCEIGCSVRVNGKSLRCYPGQIRAFDVSVVDVPEMLFTELGKEEIDFNETPETVLAKSGNWKIEDGIAFVEAISGEVVDPEISRFELAKRIARVRDEKASIPENLNHV